jgi:hypothetical protein
MTTEGARKQGGTDPMTRIEMVKDALGQIGDVSAQELSAFIEKKFGVTIEPAYVPIFRATLRDKERMENSRRRDSPPVQEKK